MPDEYAGNIGLLDCVVSTDNDEHLYESHQDGVHRFRLIVFGLEFSERGYELRDGFYINSHTIME